jgi:hypothetical protein
MQSDLVEKGAFTTAKCYPGIAQLLQDAVRQAAARVPPRDNETQREELVLGSRRLRRGSRIPIPDQRRMGDEARHLAQWALAALMGAAASTQTRTNAILWTTPRSVSW